MSRNPQGEPRTAEDHLLHEALDQMRREHAHHVYGFRCAGCDALRKVDAAALRAIESPAHPETGLDVERLARAIEKVTLTPVTLGPDLDESLTEYQWQAEAIAREYAAEPRP